MIRMPPHVRAFAFYLPQFHPIPENSGWWSPGFTEWTNVAKARPLFPGHYQPHIPADLGFYDLRLAETREEQAALARAYGLEAFIYYHYWFAGRRLIERPFNEVLASGRPEFGFCLCWANQTWSGIWHGAENRVLIEQTYPGEDDHRRHFDALLPAFRDPRYVRIDGKPVFFLFRPREIPDPLVFTDLWRRLAEEAGFPGLFLVGETDAPRWQPRDVGLDASVLVRMPPKRRSWEPWSRPHRKIMGMVQDLFGLPTVHLYSRVVGSLVSPPVDDITSFPSVIPNRDNTPRSGKKGKVLHGSTPEQFRLHVRRAVEQLHAGPPEHRIIVVKSWNEWGEGNHLEPDLRFGRQYLEVLREELCR